MALRSEIPWRNLRRDKQVPPEGDWLTWLILTGRGWGKTRVGAEWVLENADQYRRFVLAGRTSGDLRDIMVEGESGIMSIARERPHYEPSKRRITFSSGSVAVLRSADEPEGFRGLQADAVWADELAAWEHPEAWDQLQLGFRLGHHPRQVVTTTPRPRPFLMELMREPGTITTVGSTYENRANLSPKFMRDVVRKYEGTRIGRQELHAELLTDVPGALWTRDMIRYDVAPLHGVPGKAELEPDYLRVVVAIDPAVTYGPDADETGIVVVAKGTNGRGYVLDDQSGRFSPSEWAQRAKALHDTHGADAIVAEVNNGGDLVESNLRNNGFGGAYKAVRASRGKRTRAEPTSGMYEQGKISHVRAFPELEDQLCNFTPDTLISPDRLDALVWGFTELFPPVQVITGDFALSG